MSALEMNSSPTPFKLRVLPFMVALALLTMNEQTAIARSNETSAAFTATQLVRQFTLKNTVAQVSQGMQGYVQEFNDQLRSAAMGPTPNGYPVGMGSVPVATNLPQRDGAGRPLGYCAWDNSSVTTDASFLAGSGLANPLVYAVVSPGLNGSIETSCADIHANRTGNGDDFVQVTVPIQTSSRQFRSSIGTEAELFAMAGENGDVRLVAENNRLYSYLNGSWSQIGPASTFNDDSVANGAGAISYTSGKVTVADFEAAAATINAGLTVGGSTVLNGGLAVVGNSSLTGDLTVSGTITSATGFSGSGALLTDLNASNFSSGVLGVAQGGTGITTAPIDGQILIGAGGGYALGSIAGAPNQVIVTNGAGSIALSLPQDIATTSSPTFGGLALNGALTGVTATFTGDVSIGTLTLERLNLGSSVGVTNPNLVIGNGAMLATASGTGGNTAVGTNVLQSNTSGFENVAVGQSALRNNTTGFVNSAFGVDALRDNTTGFANSAFGNDALVLNTVGQRNAAFGDDALFVNTTGSRNTAMGGYGLLSNTTGDNNTALGSYSGQTNTTGNSNTFVGSYADVTTGSLTYASAIGSDSRVATSATIALGRNSNLDQIVIGTDSRNDTLANTKLYVNGAMNLNGELRATTANFSGAVTMGSLSLERLNIGTSAGVGEPNFIIGQGAMVGAQSGSGANTAVGVLALAANTNGYFNTGVGNKALRANTTGHSNTALGISALEFNTTGGDNTAVGRDALYINTTGSHNVALGIYSGNSNTTGNDNTFLGNQADATSGALSYAAAIGSHSSVATSNTIALGRNSMADQIVIGTDSRNDTHANTKLYVNGVTNLNGDLRGSTATFSGAVSALNFAGDGSALTNLDTSQFTTGTLPVARGGTGVDGTNAANGQLLIGNGTGYTLGNITGTANQITVTNGAGSIALSLPQDIAITSSPTFNRLTLTSLDIGDNTGVVNRNLAIGTGALIQPQSGNGGNTAVGPIALNQNTSGSANTAIGRLALSNNTTGFNNSALGFESLLKNIDGYSNTAIGQRSLRENLTGYRNTALGASSMRLNTSGFENSSIGEFSLSSLTSGSFNVAIGNYSGDTLTTGTNNTFLGANADATTGALTYASAIGSDSSVATSNTIALGRNSTTDQVVIGSSSRNDTVANTKLYVNGATNLNGDLRGTTATFSGAVNMGVLALERLNISTSAGGVTDPNLIIGTGAMTGVQSGLGGNAAVGVNTLQANTTGYDNSAFGTYAMLSTTSGYNNSAFGKNALRDNTTGSWNSVFGDDAMRSNTTGTQNAAFGDDALLSNTTGYVNTALGANAMRLNSTGYANASIGANSLQDNTTGYRNSALGEGALQNNTTGFENTGLGEDSLKGNTTGTRNVAIGSDSGILNTTGSNNTIVGYNADFTSGALSFAAAFGSNSRVATSDTIALGRNSTADQVVIGSDSRSGSHKLYVSGTALITGGVTTSSDLRLKTNVQQLDNESMLDKLSQIGAYRYNYINNPEAGTKVGVIAQELQALFPEVANYGNGDSFLSVDYSALGAMAAVGVGKLNTKFKVLDKKVDDQGILIGSLDEKLGKVDTRVKGLEDWKTGAVKKMDDMQSAIDLNIQKIADNAVAIQTNKAAIERLDDALFTLDGKVNSNTDSINGINARWNSNFNASEDGSLLTVNAVELKVSNFSAQNIRANSLYSQRIEAEMARIAELEVNNLRANRAVANTVQAEQLNTGSAQVYAGVGLPAVLFSAKSDGHYTVNTSALDGSYATATVIVNAGQAKVIAGAHEGIELYAEGNTVKAIAAGKSIKASWIKMG